MTLQGRSFPKLTKPRAYRLRRAVRLAEAARLAGLSSARASLVERNPEIARPGELERLRSGVDRAQIEAAALPACETGEVGDA